MLHHSITLLDDRTVWTTPRSRERKPTNRRICSGGRLESSSYISYICKHDFALFVSQMTQRLTTTVYTVEYTWAKPARTVVSHYVVRHDSLPQRLVSYPSLGRGHFHSWCLSTLAEKLSRSVGKLRPTELRPSSAPNPSTPNPPKTRPRAKFSSRRLRRRLKNISRH